MDMLLRPGDFPLGSVESRAAMRVAIESNEASRPRFKIRVFLIHHPPCDCRGEYCRQIPGVEGRCHNAYLELQATDDGRTFYDIVMKC
jgi:hypothetical protein